MIEICASVEELDALKDNWNYLYSKSVGVTPYQSFGFCRYAVPLLSGSLHVVCWYRNKALMAIFPLYIDSKGILRFINDRHADFCGPLVLEAACGDFHMCEELSQHIRDTRGIRRVRLENIRYDLFQSSLQYQLKGALLYSYSRYSLFFVPGVCDAESVIDSLAQLSKKEKYKLKNIRSKIEKSGAQWRLYDAANQDSWPGEFIKKLTDSMVEAGIRKRKYFSEDYLRFVRDVYESGALVVSTTFSEGEAVSCNLYLKNGKEYIDWMAFYVEPSINAWNLLQFLDWYHSSGGGFLNFARGIYMYKLHNYRPALGSLDRLHYSKSICGKVGDVVSCLISEVKRMNKSR